MAIGVGAWAVDAWQANGAPQWMALAGLGFGSAAGLAIYGRRFLQKARRLGLAGLLIAGSVALPGDALACPACAAGSTDSILRSGNERPRRHHKVDAPKHRLLLVGDREIMDLERRGLCC
jgi:hypothetical protein